MNETDSPRFDDAPVMLVPISVDLPPLVRVDTISVAGGTESIREFDAVYDAYWIGADVAGGYVALGSNPPAATMIYLGAGGAVKLPALDRRVTLNNPTGGAIVFTIIACAPDDAVHYNP